MEHLTPKNQRKKRSIRLRLSRELFPFPNSRFNAASKNKQTLCNYRSLANGATKRAQ